MDTRPRIRYFFYDIYVASNQMLRPEASGDNGNSRRELVPAEQRATPLISCICRCTLFQGTPRPSLLPVLTLKFSYASLSRISCLPRKLTPLCRQLL
ncbi:hypothetical protein V6N13_035395 [Hibiscus sabdariffa]